MASHPSSALDFHQYFIVIRMPFSIVMEACRNNKNKRPRKVLAAPDGVDSKGVRFAGRASFPNAA